MIRTESNRGGRIWLPLFLCLFLLPASVQSKDLELKRLPVAEREATTSGAGERPVQSVPGLEAVDEAAEHVRNQRAFPHLLFSDAPRRNGPLRARPGVVIGEGNAFYDPALKLPPSVLSPARRNAVLDLLGAENGDDLIERWSSQRSALQGAAPDTARICVLRVDFLADRPGDRSSGDGRFDLRTEVDPPINFDPPPHNKAYFSRHMDALARYFDVQTNGTLVLDYEVFPSGEEDAYHLPDTFRYGPWIFSNSNPDVLQHAIDLVGDSLLEANEDEDIDFSQFDHFIIFHAGPDFQGDVNRNSPWDIPSFNLFVVDPFVVQDTVAIDLVMVAPETVAQDGFSGAINGVVTHEFGHQLGFWDLYDVRVGLPVVGAFSLMDSGDNLFALIEDPNQPGRNLAIRGTLPASLDPWHKLNWFPDGVDLTFSDDILTESNREFDTTLETVQINNQLMQVPLNLNEYLLLENRHLDLNGDGTVIVRQDPETGVILGPEPDSTEAPGSLANLEYDWLIPGEGVLAWKFDFLSFNTGRSQPGGGINIFFNRPGLQLIEADGIRDIGTASSEFLGGPLDPFFKGGYDLLAPNTLPSSNTNDGTRTGVEFAVLDTIGMEMRVRVRSDLLPPGWPVRVGANPGSGQVLALDLDTSGQSSLVFPGVDSANGPVLLNLLRDGGGAFLFSNLLGEVEGGIAGRNDFSGGSRTPRPLVAVVNGGRLQMLEANGDALLTYPAPADPASTETWSTPVLGTQSLWVAEGDQLLRIDPASIDPVVAFSPPSGGRDVSSLAVWFAGNTTDVFWASTGGRVGLNRYSSDGSFTDVWSKESTLSGGATATRARSVVALEQAGQLSAFFVAWEDGTMEWRGASGELRSGWPIRTERTLVGEPIVVDFDRDGSLEVIAIDEDGLMSSWNENGAREIDWPRSAWSEDELPVLQRVGPRVMDVDGDGEAELVLLRGDGFVYAWEADGEVVAGWPLSFGTPGLHGPLPVPAGDGYEARLAVGNLEGVTSDGVTIETVSMARIPELQAEGVGYFAYDGFNPARTRVIPSDFQPGSVDAIAGVSELRMYPNPVRGDRLSLHTVLGSEAKVRVDAFDLAGDLVSTDEWSGRSGADGNVFEWDISGISSGLYHVRVRIEGDGIDFERFEKIAVVR